MEQPCLLTSENAVKSTSWSNSRRYFFETVVEDSQKFEHFVIFEMMILN